MDFIIYLNIYVIEYVVSDELLFIYLFWFKVTESILVILKLLILVIDYFFNFFCKIRNSLNFYLLLFN